MAEKFRIALESIDSEKARSIIDEILSLEWCRQNLVVPVGLGVEGPAGRSCLLIAVGNFAYLGTVGEFIKQRVAKDYHKCIFVDLEPEVISKLLDEATTSPSTQ